MVLLARLAMSKQPRGMNEKERAFVMKDYTDRLFYHKAKEIDLFEAIDEIIETDPSDFFPSYAKLHKKTFGTTEAKTHD